MPLSTVNFANLTAPTVVEPLDFASIVSTMAADLLMRDPSLTAVNIESSPLRKLIEVCAYRELLLRQRVNDAAKSVMLAYATATDLDQIGANFGVPRLLITPANAKAVPPVAAVYETDEAFRARILLSMYRKTTAGSANQYKYYALSADPLISDVSVISLNPGEVTLTVLAQAGVPTQTTLDAVLATCNATDVRPLTDGVQVQAVVLITYNVTAALTLYPNGDAVTIQNASIAAVQNYCNSHFALGHDITRAGLIAAATVSGVQNVNLTAPAADVIVDDVHAPQLSSLNISTAGTAL